MMTKQPSLETLINTLRKTLEKAEGVNNEHEIEKVWISELAQAGFLYTPKKYTNYDLFRIPYKVGENPEFNKAKIVEKDNHKEHPPLHADINLYKTIIEFKRFYSRVDANPCIYSNCKIDNSTFDKWPVENNEWSSEALFKENGSEYFTFFKEGQIWHDISRLMAFSKDENLFLAGVFTHKIYKDENPVSEIEKKLKNEDYIVCKIKSIIKYFKDSQCNGTYYMPKMGIVLKLQFTGQFDFEIDNNMVVIGKNKTGYLVKITKTT